MVFYLPLIYSSNMDVCMSIYVVSEKAASVWGLVLNCIGIKVCVQVPHSCAIFQCYNACVLDLFLQTPTLQELWQSRVGAAFFIVYSNRYYFT